MANLYNKRSQLVKKPPVCRPIPTGPAPAFTVKFIPDQVDASGSGPESLELVAETLFGNEPSMATVTYYDKINGLSGPNAMLVPGTITVSFTHDEPHGSISLRAIVQHPTLGTTSAWALANVT